MTGCTTICNHELQLSQIHAAINFTFYVQNKGHVIFPWVLMETIEYPGMEEATEVQLLCQIENLISFIAELKFSYCNTLKARRLAC